MEWKNIFSEVEIGIWWIEIVKNKECVQDRHCQVHWPRYCIVPLITLKKRFLLWLNFANNTKHIWRQHKHCFHKCSVETKCQVQINTICLTWFSLQAVRTQYEVRNWPLYFLFVVSATLGNEVFYISFLPFIHWNLDPFLCRRLVNMWAVRDRNTKTNLIYTILHKWMQLHMLYTYIQMV